MATATKKRPAKKAAAEKGDSNKDQKISREERLEARKKLGDKIVEMRNEDPPRKWEEIAGELGTSTGRAMLLYMESTVRPKDRIRGANDEELGKKIAAARDEDRLSWGQIMARTGLSETKCRKLYEDATGTSTRGHRIGKGGRYPDGTTPPARPAKAKEAAVKRAVAKKAAAKKGAAKTGGPSAAAKKIAGLTEISDIADAVKGKMVTHAGGKVRVGDLLDVTGEGLEMVLEIEDTHGDEHTINVSTITKVAAR